MMSLRSSNNPLANKNGVTIEDLVNDSDVFKDSITFDYKLNDKAAKAKIVKGAKRIAFEIQENSTSTTLVFSSGSWQVAALPAANYWNQVKCDLTCKVGEITIKVGGVKSGKDVSGNNVVNQVVFYVDRNKVVCHMYNTTQRILVNGHGYQLFVEAFLKPFFQAKIEASSDEIQSLNIKLIDKLGPKTVKRSNVKFKGGMSYPCNKCDYSFKNISSLNTHKTYKHLEVSNFLKLLFTHKMYIQTHYFTVILVSSNLRMKWV